MEKRNVDLYKGLHLMYQGNVVALIAAVITKLFSSVLMLAVLGLITALVGAVLTVVGLVKLRKLHPDYQNAVSAWAVGLIAGLLALTGGGFSILMEMVSCIANLCQVYFLIRATNSFLREYGFEEVAAQGDKAWKYELWATIGAVVGGILALTVNIIALLGVLLGAIMGVAALLVTVNYLKESSEAFAPADETH